MRAVYLQIRQVAPSDTTALIRGESGTGKELVASAIHYASPRAKRPFVKVNCAALNENLLESELFGHEKGAFTGALCARAGRLEEAEGGTLFLDEIGDFSPALQVKLLRVLQEREYQRVGSNRTLKADVRIIAATNQDLEARMSEGLFRQDLYYRINVFPISLPPLRDRKDDILLLADHFVAKYAKKMGKEVRRISTPAINMMFAYHWPGNVRELENCIEYAVLLTSDGVIHGQNLPPTLQLPEASESVRQGLLRTRVELLEHDMITDALKSCQGSVSMVARAAWHHASHGPLQDQETGHRLPLFSKGPLANAGVLEDRDAILARSLRRRPYAAASRQRFPRTASTRHFFPSMQIDALLGDSAIFPGASSISPLASRDNHFPPGPASAAGGTLVLPGIPGTCSNFLRFSSRGTPLAIRLEERQRLRGVLTRHVASRTTRGVDEDAKDRNLRQGRNRQVDDHAEHGRGPGRRWDAR